MTDKANSINEAWQIASIIWEMPVEQLLDIFDCDIEDIFKSYSPLEAKHILHNAGVV